MRFLSCVCLELAVCRAVRRMMGMTRTGWFCWSVLLVLYLVSMPLTFPTMEVAMWGGWCLFFMMPCVLCWWVAMATLRRDAVRYRSRWLCVMYVGPTCLLMLALGVVIGSGWIVELYSVVQGKSLIISSLAWGAMVGVAVCSVVLSVFPYVWLALVLEYLFLPAPASRADEETPQV